MLKKRMKNLLNRESIQKDFYGLIEFQLMPVHNFSSLYQELPSKMVFPVLDLANWLEQSRTCPITTNAHMLQEPFHLYL